MSRLSITVALASALAMTALWPAAAAAGFPTGNPPVTRITPDLHVLPENFDIAQDRLGALYVANSEGVLVHDGARWSLLRLPGDDLPRRVCFDGVARVYVGSFRGTAGYIERDATGEARFHDLSEVFNALVPEGHFGQMQSIGVYAEGVLFAAREDLFLYDPQRQTARWWRQPGKYGGQALYRGKPVIQVREIGLHAYEGGEWRPLPGGEHVTERAEFLLPQPGDGLLAVQESGVMQLYRDGRVRDIAWPDNLPAGSLITGALALEDGRIGFISLDGQFSVADLASGHAQRFRIDPAALVGLIRARDGGLLTTGDQHSYRIAWPSAWMEIGQEDGINGAVYRTRRWGRQWYLLTSAGIIEWRDTGPVPHPEWGETEGWDLLDLEDGTALMVNAEGVMQLPHGMDRNLIGAKSSFQPYWLLRSLFEREVVYAITDEGLGVLRRQQGRFDLVLRPGDKRDDLNTAVETAPREVWLGVSNGPVQRLQLAADYRSVSARQSFAAAEGIEYGAHAASSVGRLHDGTLVASTSRGLFRWDTAAARFVADDLGGLAPLRRYPELLLHVQTAPTGEDWAFNQWELFSRPVGGAWQREDLRDAFSGTIDDLTFDTDGSPILTATSVVLHGDRQQRGSPGMTPLVQLRAVEQVQGATRQRLPLVASPPAFEASALGGLDFQVGLPEYRRGQPVRYRARLLGQGDVEFSDWSESGHFSYRNLKPGDYRFEARARDVQGMVTAIAPYAFSVLPPWHATAWGRLLLGSLALLLLAAGNAAVLRLRTRALRREQGRLESLVVQRTRDLESANRQLHGLAYLDALTQVPNRRRLDEYLAEVWQQCLQHGREMSVIVLDGDGFKRYNDVQGHEAGDRLICQIATVLSGSLRRAEDLLARYGGDEFVVVLPGAPAAQALQVAEHMRQRIEAEQLPVTLSAGVATRRPLEGASVTDLTQAADEALYEAKRRGRNCVVMAPEA